MAAISVVMPMFGAGGYVERVLPPLSRALREGRVLEVIVVDDGSTDDGPQRARAAGFTVLSSGGRKGPAASRNLGAAAAKGELLLFLDADVVMHDDVPERIAAAFAARPDVVAIFGAYDERPAAPGLVSRYRNLLHHFVHLTHAGEATTFWAGCGAVRRSAFEQVGGFDAEHYATPSMEDIELGYRMAKLGPILLVPEIQGTHLKRWTFAGMLRTDVLQRALPWGRLLQHPNRARVALNVSNAERIKALIAGGFFLCLALAPFDARWLGAAAATLAVAIVVNGAFYRLVLRAAGLPTAIAAVFLHQLYFLYSAVTYVWCVLERRLGLSPPPPNGKPIPTD